VGGPEKQILGQCVLLDRSRFEPLVVSFAGPKPNSLIAAADEMQIRSMSIPDGKLALPNAVRQLRGLLKSNGRCVVVSSGFKADFTAWLACSREGVPWIAWFHGHTGVTRRVRAYEALDMLAVHRANAVVAVCETVARQLRAAGLRNVVAVPNAVDVAGIVLQGTREHARRELGIGEMDLVVGTAARLSPEKGIGHMIDAAPEVLSRHPVARFVVIGDGAMRESLQRRARELGVSRWFSFTGFRADASALIKGMDIFVLPSLRENLPVALLEAMACGVSVVATDVGGVREVLGVTGVEPVEPGSSKAISWAVNRLLDDSHLRGSCAAALAERAMEFSFERQVTLMQVAIENAER